MWKWFCTPGVFVFFKKRLNSFDKVWCIQIIYPQTLRVLIIHFFPTFTKYFRETKCSFNANVSLKCIWRFKIKFRGDLLGGPVVKTELPTKGVQTQSLVRELDPTCCGPWPKD